MPIFSYAVLDEGGTIVNIAAIDTEAVGFDDAERGRFEPWGHDRARQEGWVLLHGALPAIGWKTSDDGKTFAHPEDPNLVHVCPEPLSDG